MFGFSKLGPLEVTCDAPSYKVVQACRRVGLQEPEDVRWCRLRDFLQAPAGWKNLFRRLIAGEEPEQKACSCGARLPSLDRVTFTFTTGHEITYLIGQCRRCRTIYWDEA